VLRRIDAGFLDTADKQPCVAERHGQVAAVSLHGQPCAGGIEITPPPQTRLDRLDPRQRHNQMVAGTHSARSSTMCPTAVLLAGTW
jgi:hypothetical protein